MVLLASGASGTTSHDPFDEEDDVDDGDEHYRNGDRTFSSEADSKGVEGVLTYIAKPLQPS